MASGCCSLSVCSFLQMTPSDVINFAQNKAVRLQNENLIDKESKGPLLRFFIVPWCRQNGVRVSLLEHPFLSALVQGSLATRKVRQDFSFPQASRPGRPPRSRSPAGTWVWGKGRFGLPLLACPACPAVLLPAQGEQLCAPSWSDGPSPTAGMVLHSPPRGLHQLSLLSLLASQTAGEGDIADAWPQDHLNRWLPQADEANLIDFTNEAMSSGGGGSPGEAQLSFLDGQPRAASTLQEAASCPVELLSRPQEGE